MKRLIVLLALGALAAFGLSHVFAATQPTRAAYLPMVSCTSGCAGPTSAPATPMPVTATPIPNTSAYAGRMITLVNQARAAASCPAVVSNATLMRAAQDWSHTMASTHNYSHSGGNFYSSYGYTWGALENIGPGETPDYAFESWMQSPPHKANIEYCYPTSDPSYNPARIYEVGVGYESGYWTLVIGWHVP